MTALNEDGSTVRCAMLREYHCVPITRCGVCNATQRTESCMPVICSSCGVREDAGLSHLPECRNGHR
jgi:hypothetical protein